MAVNDDLPLNASAIEQYDKLRINRLQQDLQAIEQTSHKLRLFNIDQGHDAQHEVLKNDKTRAEKKRKQKEGEIKEDYIRRAISPTRAIFGIAAIKAVAELAGLMNKDKTIAEVGVEGAKIGIDKVKAEIKEGGLMKTAKLAGSLLLPNVGQFWPPNEIGSKWKNASIIGKTSMVMTGIEMAMIGALALSLVFTGGLSLPVVLTYFAVRSSAKVLLKAATLLIRTASMKNIADKALKIIKAPFKLARSFNSNWRGSGAAKYGRDMSQRRFDELYKYADSTTRTKMDTMIDRGLVRPRGSYRFQWLFKSSSRPEKTWRERLAANRNARDGWREKRYKNFGNKHGPDSGIRIPFTTIRILKTPSAFIYRNTTAIPYRLAKVAPSPIRAIADLSMETAERAIAMTTMVAQSLVRSQIGSVFAMAQIFTILGRSNVPTVAGANTDMAMAQASESLIKNARVIGGGVGKHTTAAAAQIKRGDSRGRTR